MEDLPSVTKNVLRNRELAHEKLKIRMNLPVSPKNTVVPVRFSNFHGPNLYLLKTCCNWPSAIANINKDKVCSAYALITLENMFSIHIHVRKGKNHFLLCFPLLLMNDTCTEECISRACYKTFTVWEIRVVLVVLV